MAWSCNRAGRGSPHPLHLLLLSHCRHVDLPYDRRSLTPTPASTSRGSEIRSPEYSTGGEPPQGARGTRLICAKPVSFGIASSAPAASASERFSLALTTATGVHGF